MDFILQTLSRVRKWQWLVGEPGCCLPSSHAYNPLGIAAGPRGGLLSAGRLHLDDQGPGGGQGLRPFDPERVAGHASLDPGLGGTSLDDGRNGYGAQPGSRLAGHGQGVARLEAAASVGVQETPGRSEGGVVFP